MIDLSQHKDCSEYREEKRKIVFHEENRMRYEISNDSLFCISKYLPTLIVAKNEGGKKSSDCLFLLDDKKQHGSTRKIVLVELKNPDIVAAVRQINQSLDDLQICKKSNLQEVHGRIIPRDTFGPDLRHTEFKKLQIRFNALKGNLLSKNKFLKESF